MITDRDIAMAGYTQGKRLNDIPVRVAMSRKAITVKPKEEIAKAQELMRRHAVRRVPVIEDDGRVVGMLSLSDIAREALRERERKNPALTMPEVTETLAALSAPRSGRAPAPGVPAL
jgi:CBS-domain-containing membrane protein